MSLAVADDVFVGLQLLAPDCETGQGLPEQQNITKLKMRGVPGILVGGWWMWIRFGQYRVLDGL